MHTMLIVEGLEDLRAALYDAMKQQYQITLCADGEEGLQMLNTQKPHILILNIQIPILDGLELLRRAKYLPPVILALGTMINGYTGQCLKDMGVGHFLMLPTPVQNIARHVALLIKWSESADPFSGDPQVQTSKLLQKLGIQSHRDGYQQLKVCIPLFAQDPAQNMSKELYLEVANLCGYDNERQIERSIRSAIKSAWLIRDPSVWAEFFPPDGQGQTHCPESKEFIARLAEILIETMK